MKKIILFITALVAVLSLNGCGTLDDYDELTTLFLVDANNQPVEGVPYICDSMAHYQRTARNGEFSFYPGESCEFDFLGFSGTNNFDPLSDEVIYIVDIDLEGKESIPYSCDTFSGRTYLDGDFDYGENDRCEFYL